MDYGRSVGKQKRRRKGLARTNKTVAEKETPRANREREGYNGTRDPKKRLAQKFAMKTEKELQR